jgi:hypothetical protein
MLIQQTDIFCTLAKVAETGNFNLGPERAPTRGGVGIIYAGVPGAWSSFSWDEQRTLLGSCVRRGLLEMEASSAGLFYRLSPLGREVHERRAPVPPVPDPDAVATAGPASGFKGFEEAQRAAGNVQVERGVNRMIDQRAKQLADARRMRAERAAHEASFRMPRGGMILSPEPEPEHVYLATEEPLDLDAEAERLDGQATRLTSTFRTAQMRGEA